MKKGAENLIPINKRTKEEARKISSKGGKASGEARQAKKTFKDCMNMLLALPVNNSNDINKLAELGIDFDIMDNRALVTAALMRKAMEGDVQAVKEIRNITGEDKEEVKNETVVQIIDDI